MLKLGKLKIHYSFLLFSFLLIALGQIKQFFLVVSAVTLHELSHMLAAKASKLRIDGMLITPLGETAYIEGFDSLPSHRKYIILLAGPLVNIIIFTLIFAFLNELNTTLTSFAAINLAIGLFNLLPVYPLDGGKLLFVFLGNRHGILKSIGIIKPLTKAGIGALLFLGFMQLVLFPFNMSLIAVGIFLVSVFEREKGAMVFSYYKCMLGKTGRLRTGMKTKSLAFSKDAAISEIERFFTWDFFHIIHVVDGGEIIGSASEKQVFEAAFVPGVRRETKLLDILGVHGIIGDMEQ